MFDDPKKELEELEKKLLSPENDEWLDRQLAEAYALIGDMPDTRANQAPTGQPRTVPVQQKKKKKVDFLNILIIVELLGITGIAAYWAVMLLG